MKKTLLTAVSVVALTVGGAAFAETQTSSANRNNNAANTAPKSDLQRNWDETKQAVSDATKDTAEAVEDTYEDIRAALITDDSKPSDAKTITIDPRYTANGIIGKNVYNGDGESVGKIHDIIVDKGGNAKMVIVSDGEFFGMGKQAAFDYKLISSRTEDGDAIAPLTEEMIDKAREFSYDRGDESETVRVIPEGSYSLSELLDGQLVNTKKERVAEIDNVTLRQGKADQLILGFDKVLGFGGDKAAMDFGSAKLIRDGSGYDFQLNARQAAQFESYKNAVN